MPLMHSPQQPGKAMGLLLALAVRQLRAQHLLFDHASFVVSGPVNILGSGGCAYHQVTK